MRLLITEDYRRLCQDMHKEMPWGTKGYRYIDDFIFFVHELGCKTILDYGCGQQTIKKELSEQFPDLVVNGYDPAIPEVADLPDPVDFVVCTDVMEHVEEPFVSNTLEHIHSLARRGAYFCIALTPAKRHLPDGQNAHITLKSAQWWLERIQALPWRMQNVNLGSKTLKVHLKSK